MRSIHSNVGLPKKAIIAQVIRELPAIEVQIKNPKNNKNQLSKDEILKEVLAGLKSANQFLKTNYKLSQIYFVPSIDGPSSIYKGLARTLIIHYHIIIGEIISKIQYLEFFELISPMII